MREIIEGILEDSIKIKKEFIKNNTSFLLETAKTIINCFDNGGNLLICGNGGSAADAQHIATEFVSRFQHDRKALPAIALTTDTSILTAISNDYSFDQVFSRQIEAIGRKGDVLLAISTSGKSKNILNAIDTANRMDIHVVKLFGAPSKVTARIQECHILAGHIICELVEGHYVTKL